MNWDRVNTDREFSANFDREGGANCIAERGTGMRTHASAARHAVECAEFGRTKDVS